MFVNACFEAKNGKIKRHSGRLKSKSHYTKIYKMEIGISTATLFGRLYNEDALPLLERLDSRVCEVFLETYCEYTESFANLLKSRLGGLKVHSIHTLNTHFEPQLFSPCDRTRNDAVEIFENCLKAGKILGAQNYTMHGKAKFKKGVVYNDYEQIGMYMNELTLLAEKYGINVCLENVEWAFYDRPGFYSKIKKYAPKLCATLDVKQARVSGFDYKEYLEETGAGLKTVHLSDIDENGKTALPKKGGYFDFEELFRLLKHNGFNGNCLIEVYKENYADYNELACSLAYLREIKEKIF